MMHRDKPKISLIISVFRQRWIMPIVLPSIAAQDCPVPFEVLFCDDGSDDNLLQDIQSTRSLDNLDVRYLWQPNRGFRLSRSRNNAIRCAQGEVVVFADGDSWLAAEFLQEHWDAHCGRRVLVAGTRSHITVQKSDSEDDIRRRIKRASHCSTSGESLEQQTWTTTDRPWMACTGGNLSAPRSSELNFDEEFQGWGSEDRDICCRLHRSGCDVVFLARPNVVHVKRSGERSIMTHRDVVEALKGKVWLRQKYPNGEMEDAMGLVSECRLDPVADTWSLAPNSRGGNVNAVLDQFQAWCLRHGEA